MVLLGYEVEEVLAHEEVLVRDKSGVVDVHQTHYLLHHHWPFLLVKLALVHHFQEILLPASLLVHLAFFFVGAMEVVLDVDQVGAAVRVY